MNEQWYLELAARTSALAIENTVKGISEKVKQAKSNKDKDKTIMQLEEIIRDLQNDRSELLNIVQIYEDEFVNQKISDEDLEKIREDLIPIIKNFIDLYSESGLDQTGDFDSEQMNSIIDMLAPLLSKEVLSILQTIGFNYKAGIGEPLTKLINYLILRNVNQNNSNIELQISNNQKEKALYELLSDEEAYNRLQEAFNHDN